MCARPPRPRTAGEKGNIDRYLLGLAAAAALVHATERTRRPQGPCGECRRVRAGGGQMVQPRSRLRFREAARRIGRRGRVRTHGNGAQFAPSRASAGTDARGADRAERQGPDSGRASRLRRAGGIAGALIALIACSPPAPAQNPAPESLPAQNQPVDNVPPEAAPASNLLTVPQTGLRQVPLTIRSKNGVHKFTVDVAATPEEQERGLMFVKSL